VKLRKKPARCRRVVVVSTLGGTGRWKVAVDGRVHWMVQKGRNGAERQEWCTWVLEGTGLVREGERLGA
jgi:hypothetical protein